MNFSDIAIGTDIEEISRFESMERNKDGKFLARIFTEQELDYCYSAKISAPHLCARFCAKEAIVKALSQLNIKDVYYSDIEIMKKEDGTPFAIINKHSELKVKISLSHCKTHATASTIILKDWLKNLQDIL